jgi:hypothetical protein
MNCVSTMPASLDARPTSAPPVCPACGQGLPGGNGRPRTLIEALTLGYFTSTELAKLLGRRRQSVEQELCELERGGIVERLAESGRGRAWRRRPWRLVQTASGRTLDGRWSDGEPSDDLLPLLPFFVSVGAAGESEHLRAQVAFLGAAVLFLVALLLEIEAQASGGRS